MKRSKPERSEDQLVVWAAARLVRRAREIAPDYAARTVQAGTHMVSKLLTEEGCYLSFQPLSAAREAMVLPPVDGVNVIVLNSEGGWADADLRVRHELAHVLAGDVEEPTFMSAESEDWNERVADAFALADLIPANEIALARGVRRPLRPWRDVFQVLQDYCATFGGQWDAARVEDRARLRLMLYRAHGI